MADANPLASDDDVQLQSPQDDFDTHGIDMVTHEITGDISKDMGIPAKELKQELDNRAIEDEGNDPSNNEADFDSDDALNEMEGRE